MVKNLTKRVQNLTEKMSKLKLGFDRAAYRVAYDKVYFKRTAACPNCGEIKVRHMLKRHMKTNKCKRAVERVAGAVNS